MPLWLELVYTVVLETTAHRASGFESLGRHQQSWAGVNWKHTGLCPRSYRFKSCALDQHGFDARRGYCLQNSYQWVRLLPLPPTREDMGRIGKRMTRARNIKGGVVVPGIGAVARFLARSSRSSIPKSAAPIGRMAKASQAAAGSTSAYRPGGRGPRVRSRRRR